MSWNFPKLHAERGHGVFLACPPPPREAMQILTAEFIVPFFFKTLYIFPCFSKIKFIKAQQLKRGPHLRMPLKRMYFFYFGKYAYVWYRLFLGNELLKRCNKSFFFFFKIWKKICSVVKWTFFFFYWQENFDVLFLKFLLNSKGLGNP
jgi:hypothetical protein